MLIPISVLVYCVAGGIKVCAHGAVSWQKLCCRFLPNLQLSIREGPALCHLCQPGKLPLLLLLMHAAGQSSALLSSTV